MNWRNFAFLHDVRNVARDWWSSLSLTSQFAIATSIILVCGMITIGQWVTRVVSDAVIDSHATAAALYSDSFIEPLVQELATQPRLSEKSERALDGLLLPQALGQPIIGFRIWKGDTIVYSDRAEMIGKSFPPSDRRKRAWTGQINAEYDQLEPGHGSPDRPSAPVLEIYAPVRKTGTSNIVALAETYQIEPALPHALTSARLSSWLVIGGITCLMLLAQLAVVTRGSRTIVAQRKALAERIEELSRLLKENDALRLRAADGNRRVLEMNERFLRRVGSDLHDGPIQMLGAAALQIDNVADLVDDAEVDDKRKETARRAVAILREAIQDSMSDVRSISSGLVLPDIEQLPLPALLESVAQRHERRTGTPVAIKIGDVPHDVPLALKAGLYRFAQEGLSNAFRHANGQGQSLTAGVHDRHIECSVLDDGPGLSWQVREEGQGLLGLKDRIEALGGEFTAVTRPEGGARLTVRIPCALAVTGELHHA